MKNNSFLEELFNSTILMRFLRVKILFILVIIPIALFQVYNGNSPHGITGALDGGGVPKLRVDFKKQ